MAAAAMARGSAREQIDVANDVQEHNEEDIVATSFKRIEELEQHGINKNDIKKLKDAGFHTVESIAHATMR
jgi:hypothetical protein